MLPVLWHRQPRAFASEYGNIILIIDCEGSHAPYKLKFARPCSSKVAEYATLVYTQPRNQQNLRQTQSAIVHCATFLFFLLVLFPASIIPDDALSQHLSLSDQPHSPPNDALSSNSQVQLPR